MAYRLFKQCANVTMLRVIFEFMRKIKQKMLIVKRDCQFTVNLLRVVNK